MRPRRERFRQAEQTYFVTFVTAQHRPFFRQEAWAQMLVNTVARYRDEFDVHDFVIMPDHVHLLLSPHGTLERAAQLIKGGFSFQAKRAFEWKFDIWQAGFSDHRIRDHEDYELHLRYIEKNSRSLPEGSRRFDSASGALSLSEEPLRLKPLS